MEAPCKRSRAPNDDDAGTGCGDRLSALPDCLLHEIMSYMQARPVVQTCVLSTRWRNLWRSVPCIDADEGESFPFTIAALSAAASFEDVLEERWEKFQDFMDILLYPGNISIAHLDKFRLCVARHSSEKKRGYRWIRRCIKYAAAAGAQAFGIQHRRQGLISSTTGSWRLRKLHLDNICLDTVFSEHVRSGCPNLEDLELKYCTCEFHAITSGSLKNLVMTDCRMVGFREITSPTLNTLVIDGGSDTEDCQLLGITAPAATSLFLRVAACNFLSGFSVREMALLAKASVRLELQALEIVDAVKILGSVSDVMTNLELSFSQAMVFGEWSATFPQFNNLMALELYRCDLSDGFETLGLFLHNSPNLERLILRRCQYSYGSKKRRGSSKSKNTEPTLCSNLVDAQCKNLKLTEIIYGGEDIRQLIELLLCISENLPNNYIKLVKN